MQIWAESGKSALPICNYSQILYQFLTFTQNLKRSPSSFLVLPEFLEAELFPYCYHQISLSICIFITVLPFHNFEICP